MRVIRWDCEQDGTLTESGLRRKLQELGYSATRYVYPPGTSFPEHTHDVEKIDAVVSGQFRITMGEDSVILGPGDAVLVPSGASHSAEVVGNQPVVSLDAIKQ